MSKSRLEKFLYALYSLDSSDLPNPLSRIEELYKCLVTGDEAPTFEPISRVEKYLMAILGGYDVDSLPNPLSRVEVLLYKLATGDDNLDDIDSFLSEHEELLAEIIRNGGVGGNIDIEYVLHTLSSRYNTLYNTAEKPVKNAILKGNTLVNLINEDKQSNYHINLSGGTSIFWIESNAFLIKPSTQYLVISNVSINTGLKLIINNNETSISCFTDSIVYDQNEVGVKKSILISKSDLTKCTTILRSYAYGNGEAKGTIQVIEYQDGMENWDIPYFEGIQSVKVPVLTTTGKNLFNHDSLILNKYQNNETRDYLISDNAKHAIYKLDVKANTTYSLNMGRSGVFYDINNQPISWFYLDKNTITTPNNCKYIIFNFVDYATNDYTETQIEEGSTATQYEPFKSNILTVNEDVTLRSNGDVYDELNLLTGRLTQRIDENNEVLAQAVVKTVDLSVVNQDGNNTKLSTFNDITHVTLSSEGLIPEAELKVAMKVEEGS